MTDRTPWWEPWNWRDEPPPIRRTSFYWPCHMVGPLTLAWSCDSYEAFAARRDGNPRYAEAAHACQLAALNAILARGYDHSVSYAERLAL